VQDETPTDSTPPQPIAQATSQTPQVSPPPSTPIDPKATAKPRAIDLSTTEVPEHLVPRKRGDKKHG